MGLTTSELTNGGFTTHYGICYDDTLPQASAIERTNGLLAKCEEDFAIMQDWFDGIDIPFDYPLGVQVLSGGPTGGSWPIPSPSMMSFGSGSFVQLRPGTNLAIDTLRYLLVAEVTEMFMMQQAGGEDGGWWADNGAFSSGNEGSIGEGLSHFLGGQFRVNNGYGNTLPGVAVTPLWLNGGRGDFVDQNPDDIFSDQTNGCTTSFIYYLHSQLQRDVRSIIRAKAATLAGVYQNLTGGIDAWKSFHDLVESHYPPWINNKRYSYSPVGDNFFPVSNLVGLSAPAELTCGYREKNGEVTIERPAMAEVFVTLTSDDPRLVSISPKYLKIPVGGNNASFTLKAAKHTLPVANQSTKIHASYAGVEKSLSITVVSPAVKSVTFPPGGIICGDPAAGTVTLNFPSREGPAPVTLTSNRPDLITVTSPLQIAQGAPSGAFTIETANIRVPFEPVEVKVWAQIGAGPKQRATIHIVPPTVAQIRLTPDTLPYGGSGHAVMTLDRKSKLGDVVVNLAWQPADFGVLQSTAQVNAGNTTSDPFAIVINAPTKSYPFETHQGVLNASYAGTAVSATLTVTPSADTGVLANLTLEKTTAVGGENFLGTVFLEQAVGVDTLVGIKAYLTGRTQPGNASLPTVTVPSEVTIPAGHTTATFTVGTTPLAPNAPVRTVAVLASAFAMKQVIVTLTS